MSAHKLGRRPTLQDVARAAGVSAMSVSNYFRHPTRLSPATAARIDREIRRLDYHPNRAASMLRRSTAQALGYVADLGERSSLDFLAGLEEVVVARGWAVQIGDSRGSAEREQQLCELLTTGGVAGVLVLPSSSAHDEPPRDRRAAGARAASELLDELAERMAAPIVVTYYRWPGVSPLNPARSAEASRP